MARICVFGANSAIAKAYTNHRKAWGDSVFPYGRDYKRGDIAPCDSIVTFAGSVDNSFLTKMEMNQWQKVIDDVLTSVARFLSEGLMKIEDGGSIVVVGSIVGSNGGYGCANYAAAKAGLGGLVRAIANETDKRGIRINLLELGYVNCGMGRRFDPDIKDRIIKTIPMRRFAEVGEVNDAIEFLRKQTYMTGNTLTFAGGLR